MLYFVATPIGNMEDISIRALNVLKNADIICCEDTRHSLKLLNRYEIKKPLLSYHKFNEKEKAFEICEKAKTLEVAVISDAGMPVVSDPGNILVNALIENGVKYSVVPGASAFVTALVLSGFPADKFCFIGFLPEKNKDKKELLDKYKNLDMTLIFYCSPYDVKRNVSDIYSVFGKRKACLVKEITKIYESTQFFELSDDFEGEFKGEYVLIVEGAEKSENPLTALSVEEHIKHYIQMGYDKKEAVKTVAKERNLPKSEVYKKTF